MVYPAIGNFEPWPASKTLEIGFQLADALTLSLPKGFPFPGEPKYQGTWDSLLFLFTEAKFRNQELNQQDPLRTRRPGSYRALADLAIKMTKGGNFVLEGRPMSSKTRKTGA